MLKAGYNDPAFIFVWILSNYCPLEDSCDFFTVLRYPKTEDLGLKPIQQNAPYNAIYISSFSLHIMI